MKEEKVSYAKESIKEAFLRILGDTPLDKVRVTTICQEAGVTRATFYFHYENIDELVVSLLNEACKDLWKLTNKEFHNSIRLLAISLEDDKDPYFLEKHQDQLSPCYRYIDFEKYKHLFSDDEVFVLLSNIIYEKEKDKLVPSIMLENNVSEEEASVAFRIILDGTMRINRIYGWEKTSEWYRQQGYVFRFALKGLNVSNWSEMKEDIMAEKK